MNTIQMKRLTPVIFVIFAMFSDSALARSQKSKACIDHLDKVFKQRMTEYIGTENRLEAERREREKNADQSLFGDCKRMIGGLIDFFTEGEAIVAKVTDASQKKCIGEAQRRMNVDRFVCCDSKSDRISDGNDFILSGKPHVNTAYTHLNTYLFVKAADCFNVDKGDLFRLISQESGFHPTIISGSGCIGIPQTDTGTVKTLKNYGGREIDNLSGTQAAIENAVNEADRRIKKDPSCGLFKRFLDYDAPSQKSCNYLHESVNPEVGYFLAAKNFLANSAAIEHQMKSWGALLPFDEDDERWGELLAALTTVGHNAGQHGILLRFPEALHAYRREIGPGTSTPKLMQFFGKYIQTRDFGNAERRWEVASYYPNVHGRAVDIMDRINEIPKPKPVYKKYIPPGKRVVPLVAEKNKHVSKYKAVKSCF